MEEIAPAKCRFCDSENVIKMKIQEPYKTEFVRICRECGRVTTYSKDKPPKRSITERFR